jgi:fumarate reductase flavoprotein subunit
MISMPEKWNSEADVIIIGAGTAGLPAGIVVAEAGCNAVILEAMTSCGGSLNIIGGTLVFAGTDEQKAAAIDDSPEILYRDLIDVSGAVPELARAYADNQLDAYRMLKEEGVKYPGLVPHPGHTKVRCHGWMAGLGPKVVEALENRARRRGVEILFKHRATRLITNPQSGRIIGVKVIVNGETKNFKAKKAVILATGGFGRNPEMVAEYTPHMLNAVPIMPAGHRGDGLKMGMAVGAATKDISVSVTPSWPVCVQTHVGAIWAVFHGGILVNKDGKRFHDESCMESYYGPLTGIAMKQPGGIYWVVYDEKIRTEVGKDCENHLKHYIARCREYKATSMEELAKSAGIDPQGLKETVNKYNSDIDAVGYDTLYGRRSQFGPYRPVEKIVTPFYAIKCVTSTTSLKGGLKINDRTQVLNQFGEVIPALYAAGEVSAGLHTKTYLLGVMTTSAMTLGIIAARNAINEPSWK